MKFNIKIKSRNKAVAEAVTNYEGAQAFALTYEQELYASVVW
jgi:hypothetical protein